VLVNFIPLPFIHKAKTLTLTQLYNRYIHIFISFYCDLLTFHLFRCGELHGIWNEARPDRVILIIFTHLCIYLLLGIPTSILMPKTRRGGQKYHLRKIIAQLHAPPSKNHFSIFHATN